MEKSLEPTTKENGKLTYGFVRFIAKIFSRTIFKCRVLRNELKKQQGPFVLLANHQSSLDIINLLAKVNNKMTIVMSKAFKSTLPLQFMLKKLNIIDKQQFQTSITDLKLMKCVVDSGNGLLIYPAGLMCENGLSTPIPKATYKFLNFLNTDVYIARTYGTYFSNAKWRKGIKSGKTYLDIYKIFDKNDLKNITEEELRKKTDEALLFDAYQEQEFLKIKYKHNDYLDGLENVLYACPHCKKEFSIKIHDKSYIKCENCGFEEKSDIFGFLHCKDKSKEIRHVSKWDCIIYDDLKEYLLKNPDYLLQDNTDILIIEKGKFVNVGKGILSIDKNFITLNGTILEKPFNLSIPTQTFNTLPFKPGKCIDIQQGEMIYRCNLEHGILTMKFIHLLKIFYEIDKGINIKNRPIKLVPNILQKLKNNKK